MNLATIEMPAKVAREKFLEYRRAVRERHSAEDQQIMRGYRELMRGNRLIRLSETLLAGGAEVRRFKTNRRGQDVTRLLPRIAVARADAERVLCSGIDDQGKVSFCWHPDPDGGWDGRQWRRGMASTNRRDVHKAGGFESKPEGVGHDWRLESARVMAGVPIVPPALRPKDKPGNYHVLFEAEWSLNPVPPVDPALLKHVGGDLYAVVAVWDLTEVERAVLAMRG